MSEEDNIGNPDPANWLESLPEQMRDAPFIGKAASLDDAIGKLAHAATLVGTSIRVPDAEKATPEDYAAFYEKIGDVPGLARLPTPEDAEGLNALLAKLGAPEDSTGYALPEFEDFEWDETIAADLKKYAKDANMTTQQFEAFAKNIAQQEHTAGLEAAQALQEQQKQLRLDWGDLLESREDLIRGWLEKSDAPPSMMAMLNERQLPVDTMKWLYDTANQFKGDVTPVANDGRPAAGSVTPEEARAQIPQILTSLTQLSPNDPRYGDLQKKLVLMHKAIDAGSRAA